MRRYSEVVKAEVRRGMGPARRQSVAEIFRKLGIYVITLYRCARSGSCRCLAGLGFVIKNKIVCLLVGINLSFIGSGFPCKSSSC